VLRTLGMVGVGLMAMLVAGVGARAGGAETRATVVYEEVATEIAGARLDGAELWVTTGDLTRATRFELKPQGVCRDELCFPLPKARREAFVREEGGARWFDLTAFARLVGQPYAHEAFVGGAGENSRSLTPLEGAGIRDDKGKSAQSVWYFGLRADQRLGGGATGNVQDVSLTAPDFSLPDMAGKNHSLAELRGKKILLVTWASW